MFKKVSCLCLALLVFASVQVDACTNFLITKGASKDGSTMITYAADSHSLYGELYFWPAADHAPGDMRDVYDWDSGKYLGQIPEIAHTYQVVGNMNEHQLVIGETTYGGRSELHSQSGAIIDYGSLIYITLQRAKTAREAIKTMASLMNTYGYYSSGESFSIGDGNEAWIMEVIGKGEGEKGAVWVARRVPDGYVSGHANQARITTFPLNDPDNCIYSDDVISFAREKGFFNGKNKDFSFSDVYAPVDFGAARFCDARVWSAFNRIAPNMKKYEQYALGKVKYDKNGVATNRFPLWVKPTEKLSAKDVMDLMRDHYEGTALDMTQDVGAGPHKLPYRWRGLTWKVDSVEYCNERATSTQQTAFSFVGQSRADMPAAIGGVLWFGMDDTYSTCYTPIYCNIEKVPECFKIGNGDLLTWSSTSAFWVFNSVTNFVYSKYDEMIVDLQKVQNKIELESVALAPAVEAAATQLWNSGNKELAKKYLSDYSITRAENMTSEWRDLGHYLMIKYLDGNVKKEKNGKFLRTKDGMPASPNHPGYPDAYYRRVVKETGDHFKVIK
ncbi:C69 family dipeptidase [Halosquirtibacter laminarini]|uniref:C69 family dipeptidase n=1 Tax=Halosquirtibacter laminarini TaxID=3374600 RepID=A0AC61NPV4_9BACT|nr:C69 family dipeptidase [Prolixibacteraceae bacterium]